MYGRSDNYGSPHNESDAVYGDLSDIDAVLEADDEEYGALLGIGKGGGVLGIAIGKKAQEKKIARILGKLKKFFEQGKFDKAQRYAKSLSKVNLIQKKGYTTPEIAAWVDFASSGDESSLREALEAVDWAGNKDEDEDDDAEVEGEVYTSAGGAGRPHRGRGRKLPPGFRPRGYSRWAPVRKSRWLSRHRRAASIRLPIDPGPMPGRGRGQGRGQGRPVRPVRPVRPLAHPSGPIGPVSPMRRVTQGGLRGTGVLRKQAQISAARTAGRVAGRRMAASRFGIEDVVDDELEDFGALIGASAFEPLQGRPTLDHSELFADDIDDDLEVEGTDDDDDDEFGAYIASFGEDDEDEFGAYIAEFGEDDDGDEFGVHIPQFGAVFRRDIDQRLEAARRRYERLRGKETDQAKVQEAYQDYQRLVRAYRQASELPSAQHAGPSLAREWGQQRDDIDEDGDYSPPEEQTFRLGGRVAEVDLEDDLDLEEV